MRDDGILEDRMKVEEGREGGKDKGSEGGGSRPLYVLPTYSLIRC